jgi:hypothetical protein
MRIRPFLYLHKSHLTAKGWMYYDSALDDFYSRAFARKLKSDHLPFAEAARER